MDAHEHEGSKTSGVEVLSLNISLETDKEDDPWMTRYGTLNVDEKRKREAWLMAQLIREQIDLKKANAGEFLVLFRKSMGMQDYEWALERLGVPVINMNTKRFLQQP